MSTQHLPTIGAAMPIQKLAHYRDWLIEAQRDLEIQDAVRPDVLDGDWKPLVRQARDVLDGYSGRLGIHGPFDGLALASRDPRVRALVAERLRRALEFGAELGAQHMVVHSPFIFLGNQFSPHAPSLGLGDYISMAHETLKDVLPLAQQIGCTLVIENILDTNAAPLVALVRSFESELVQVSVDVGHAFITHRSGGGPAPDQWVRDAGALLGHLHLQDTDGNVDRHWAPGQGNLNWYALFEALATIKQQPRMIIEIRDYAQIAAAAQWFAEHGYTR